MMGTRRATHFITVLAVVILAMLLTIAVPAVQAQDARLVLEDFIRQVRMTMQDPTAPMRHWGDPTHIEGMYAPNIDFDWEGSFARLLSYRQASSPPPNPGSRVSALSISPRPGAESLELLHRELSPPAI